MKTKLLVVVMILLCVVSSMVFAQTRSATPLRNANITNSTTTTAQQALVDHLYTDRAPMMLGWNWGGALIQVNEDLRMNTWHVEYPFKWYRTNNVNIWEVPRRLNAGAHMMMAPSWRVSKELYRSSNTASQAIPWFAEAWRADSTLDSNLRRDLQIGHGGTGLIEAQGMRFQPEITILDTLSFTPRENDNQRAVWGFTSQPYGYVPTNPADENYKRYVMEASGVTGWTTALNNSWPSDQFCEWGPGRQLEQMRSFNGHLMYLNVHLRRLNATDVTVDDEEIIRIKVHREVAGVTPAIDLIRFDSLPAPTGDFVTLPTTLEGHSRGVRWPMVEGPDQQSVTQMVITRRMIPIGTAAERDVTVQAHMRLVRPNTHSTTTFDANYIPRDRWRIGRPVVLVDAEGKKVDADRIIRMWIEVEYNGHSDVAIDWVEIGTENYTYLTQGYHDTLIHNGYIEMVDTLTRWNTNEFSNGADRLRIWRWYQRDEPPYSYWNSLGYCDDLFDGRTITELGMYNEPLGSVDRFVYTSGITDLWEGTSAKMPTEGIAPYYTQGYEGSHPKRQFYHHKWGRLSTPWKLDSITATPNDTIDYETWQTVNFEGPLPLTINPADSAAEYPKGVGAPGEGLQGAIEYHRHRKLTHAEYLFRDDIEWFPNIWTSSDYKLHREDAGSVIDTNYLNPLGQIRHYTGEELTLNVWSEIILGAKGVVHYYGPGCDSTTDKRSYAPVGSGAYQAYGMSYGTQAPRIKLWNPTENIIEDSLRTWNPALTFAQNVDINVAIANTQTTQLNSYAARNEDAGPDWLAANDRTGLWHIMDKNQYSLANALDNLYGTQTTGQYYIGWQSIRSAAQSIHEVIDRAADELSKVKLKSWYHRGFRRWMAGDTTLLRNVVLVDSVRARHPKKDPVDKRYTWESRDSTFVELTLLGYENSTVADSFVIGVLNRRASPFTYDPAWSVQDPNHTDLSTFYTYQQQYEAIAADPTKTIRYRQVGARMIEIPFEYTHPSGNAYNLRVQWLGRIDEPAQGIAALDTIIGSHTKLRLNFMPGEGAMLKVTPIPASTIGSHTNKGYLDHSNQRKMVHYPVIDTHEIVIDSIYIDSQLHTRTYFRQVNSDTSYYHRTYHRRRDDTTAEGTHIAALSVYYQRSQPIIDGTVEGGDSNYVFNASTIQWEDEILLSDRVVFEGDTSDFSCGYPAIVTRIDTTDTIAKSKVYVVYGCEGSATGGVTNILITEAVLPAQSTRAEQIAYYTAFPSQVIAQAPGTDAPVLHNWGTPMINASASGNYYCWSDNFNGIGIGYKTPDARQFAAGGKMTIGPFWDSLASHPSMNSYSRLHIGEDDAALVWQEGLTPDWGRMIQYSRLRHDAMGNIQYFANNAGPAHRVEHGAPIQFLLDSNVLTPASFVMLYHDTVAISKLRHPVVFRQMSDWKMADTAFLYKCEQVNYKAERVYWEGKVLDQNEHYIGRRVFDIGDWSVNQAVKDTIGARGVYHIYSDSLDLHCPNIAQGEQIGEPQSNPSNTSEYFEDSTKVLEFYSEHRNVTAPPQMWSMVHGFTTFYGQDKNHEDVDLIADGRLKLLHDDGRLPQQAARYSMFAHPGWQRNRRIFNTDHGTIVNFANAPFMANSSEYFFKRALATTPEALSYHGVRTEEGDALLGPVYIDSKRGYVGVNATLAPDNSTLVSAATDWFTLDEVDDIRLITRAFSTDEQVGRVDIERKSDGRRLPMNAIARNQDAKTSRKAYTLLSSPGEEFRIVFTPKNTNSHHANDIEIRIREDVALQKTNTERTILDLRSDNVLETSTSRVLSCVPNPATDEVRVIVNATSTASTFSPTASENLELTLFDATGKALLSAACSSIDVVAFDTSSLSNGTYVVVLKGTNGMLSTAKVVVLH